MELERDLSLLQGRGVEENVFNSNRVILGLATVAQATLGIIIYFLSRARFKKS